MKYQLFLDVTEILQWARRKTTFWAQTQQPFTALICLHMRNDVKSRPIQRSRILHCLFCLRSESFTTSGAQVSRCFSVEHFESFSTFCKQKRFYFHNSVVDSTLPIIFNEILFFQIFRQFKWHLNGTKWDLNVSWNPWCIGALGRSGTSAVPAYGKGVLTDLSCFLTIWAVTRSTRKNTHRNTHRDTRVIIESLSSITWSKIHWFRTIQKLQWRLHGDRSTVHLRCRLSWLERMTSHRAKELAPLRAVDSMTWRCRFPWTPL